MNLLNNKVAIVTGAGRGLGEGIARAYAAQGARVVVSDVDPDSAARVAASLPGNAIAIACDVSVPAQVEALVQQATDQCGGLHIMVNNAGISGRGALSEMSYEAWRAVMSVNLDGVFLGIRYAAPAIIATGQGGAIVNISSITAQAGTPQIGSYSASKAAVVSMTQTAALELRPHGIRVNAILPGFADTELVRKGKASLGDVLAVQSFDNLILGRQSRYGTPDDVGRLAVFLASERASLCNGGAYLIDGGARTQI